MSQPPSTTTSICDEVLNLIPAYAFGAADPEETRLVERHLHECPEALVELSTYSEMRDGMLFDAPLVAAPPQLAGRIAQIPKTKQGTSLPNASTSQTLPHKPAASPTVKTPTAINFGWAAAAAALMLIIVSNLYWFTQLRAVQTQQDEALTLVTEQARAIAALSSGEIQETTLTSADVTASESNGSLLWSRDQQVAVLRVDNLPAITQEQTYQLWLLAGDQPTSAGIFRVNPAGVGVLVLSPESAMTAFDGVGITLEPAGGSPAPTTPVLLFGEI
jgi:anti-sigma factor RsiW